MQVKNFLIAVLGFIPMLISCSKTSTETLDQMVSANGTLKWSGNFMGIGSERVSGQAKIYVTNNKYMLKLESFSTTNGPDLKVYLSKASTPSGFISLGNLLSTNGNQVYEITGNPDFSQYKFVLIHCERFNHLFGSVELMIQ